MFTVQGLLTIASKIRKSSHPKLRVTRARIYIRVTVETNVTTTRAQHEESRAHPWSTSPLGGTEKVSSFILLSFCSLSCTMQRF